MRPEDIDGLTVGGLLDLVVGRRPADEALVYADRNLRYTYKEFKAVVENCARSLMPLGIHKGDHVAVLQHGGENQRGHRRRGIATYG